MPQKEVTITFPNGSRKAGETQLFRADVSEQMFIRSKRTQHILWLLQSWIIHTEKDGFSCVNENISEQQRKQKSVDRFQWATLNQAFVVVINHKMNNEIIFVAMAICCVATHLFVFLLSQILLLTVFSDLFWPNEMFCLYLTVKAKSDRKTGRGRGGQSAAPLPNGTWLTPWAKLAPHRYKQLHCKGNNLR